MVTVIEPQLQLPFMPSASSESGCDFGSEYGLGSGILSLLVVTKVERSAKLVGYRGYKQGVNEAGRTK